MCGIAGIVLRQPNEPLREKFARLSRAHLARRGPDAFASKTIDTPTAQLELHHARLSIIDLEGGAQPMSDARGTIVYNGEIYNYRDLADSTANYRTASDTEVLLSALGRDGMDFLNRTTGMFAFAWFDEQNRKLHLARDAYGIKPLYFIKKAQSFAFSSTIPALVALSDGEVNEQALAQYYTSRAPRASETIFKDIIEVRPGERCTLDLKNWTVEKSAWARSTTVTHGNASKEELTHRLEDILDRSVKLHLVSDVPVATLLSGGIDSSLITALAATHNPDIAAFTMGFSDTRYDESPYAAALARRYGLKHHVYYCNDEEFLARLNDWPLVLDDAVANPSTVLLHAVTQFARDCGYKVLLAGEGADEFFGGYHQQRRFALVRALHGMARPFSFISRMIESAAPQKTRLIQNLKMLTDAGTFAGSSMIFEPYLASQMFAFDVEPAPLARTMREALAIDQHYRLPDDMLTATDRATMHASVEARVPFVTREVAEFAAGLDPDILVSSFRQKELLKTVARKYVPAECIDRRKVGFDLPLSRWFRTGMKEQLMESLRNTWQRDFFRPGALERIVSWHMSGKANLPDKLWAFWFLEHNVRRLKAIA